MPGTLPEALIGHCAGGHRAVTPGTAEQGGCRAQHSSVGSEEALPGLLLLPAPGAHLSVGLQGASLQLRVVPCRWGDLQPCRALLHGRCLRWGFFFSR